jgi:hypothetical protein
MRPIEAIIKSIVPATIEIIREQAIMIEEKNRSFNDLKATRDNIVTGPDSIRVDVVSSASDSVLAFRFE